MRNTDLLLYPFDNMGMQPRQKMRMFLYAGIGFAVIGTVSMVLTYMLSY
jgi:ABC-type lipoprotein release transport system permease subunit